MCAHFFVRFVEDQISERELKLKRRDFTSITVIKSHSHQLLQGTAKREPGVGLQRLEEKQKQKYAIKMLFRNSLPGQ